LSSPSPAGLLPTAIRTARRQPWVFAKVNLTLSLQPFIATPQLVGEAFFSNDLPEQQLLEYWKMTQDDSFMAFLDMVALDLPQPARVKTPLLILGAERDNMISPREIEATARAYHTQAQIVPGVAHNSMLEQRWQSVAERILAWLNEQEVVNPSIQVA
jgi:alpha-beta hydrolase superfamily lysophospholipase